MKVHPDKQTKSGSLSLALERYESSPKYNKYTAQQQQIEEQQIKIPSYERIQQPKQSLASYISQKQQQKLKQYEQYIHQQQLQMQKRQGNESLQTPINKLQPHSYSYEKDQAQNNNTLNIDSNIIMNNRGHLQDNGNFANESSNKVQARNLSNSRSRMSRKQKSLEKSNTINKANTNNNNGVNAKRSGKVENESSDQDELFKQCSSLSSKVESLKVQKYQNAVQQFQQEQQKKLAYVLSLEQQKISSKYSELQKQLTTSYEQEKLRLIKHLEEVNKFRSAYLAMKEELADKRGKVEKQYREGLGKVKETKEKLVGEWKRNSNQQIMKLGLKHI